MSKYKEKLKVGDVVKLDLKYIKLISYKGLIPSWYTSEYFEIIHINKPLEICLDRKISEFFINENRISPAFLVVDKVEYMKRQRKKKLERIVKEDKIEEIGMYVSNNYGGINVKSR